MITVSCIDKTGLTHVSYYSSLAEAIIKIIPYWNKDKGPQCFVFQKSCGDIFATMLRNAGEPEVLTIVSEIDDIKITHHCEYIFDDNGKYIRIDVKTRPLEQTTQS